MLLRYELRVEWPHLGGDLAGNVVHGVVRALHQCIRSTSSDVSCGPSRSHRRLVNVPNSREPRTVVADVSQFQREPWSKRVLQTEGPVPHVRSLQVAIDAHNRARTIEAVNRLCEVTVDRNGSIPRKTGKDCHITRRDRPSSRVSGSIDNRCGWHAGKAEAIVEGDERLPVYRLVNQAPAPTEDGRSFAVYIPGKSETRREILVVRVVGGADLLSYLHHPDIWIEIAKQVVGFLDDRVEFIAQTKVER